MFRSFIFRFQKQYALVALLLLLLEITIAIWAHDSFVRPFVGDVLAVILLYCLLRTFLRAPVWPLAIATLAFAFLLEGLQYLKLVDRLGLSHCTLARIIIGTTFQPTDFLAYGLGILFVLAVEAMRQRTFPS